MTDREFVEILKEGIPERHSASEPIAEKKAQTERAPEPQPTHWLTVPEVAKLLDLNPKTGGFPKCVRPRSPQPVLRLPLAATAA
jgi:hypothetical protein